LITKISGLSKRIGILLNNIIPSGRVPALLLIVIFSSLITEVNIKVNGEKLTYPNPKIIYHTKNYFFDNLLCGTGS
jgi:hypothetical protein